MGRTSSSRPMSVVLGAGSSAASRRARPRHSSSMLGFLLGRGKQLDARALRYRLPCAMQEVVARARRATEIGLRRLQSDQCSQRRGHSVHDGSGCIRVWRAMPVALRGRSRHIGRPSSSMCKLASVVLLAGRRARAGAVVRRSRRQHGLLQGSGSGKWYVSSGPRSRQRDAGRLSPQPSSAACAFAAAARCSSARRGRREESVVFGKAVGRRSRYPRASARASSC